MLSYLLFMIDTLRVAFPVITLFAAAPTFFILWLILRLITFIGVSRHNYRYYDDEALDQLIFIRHCRELGMSLHEIEDLNELRKDPQQQCKVVDQAIEQHLGHINHKIQQFEKFKIQLEQLRARCQSNSNIDDCKIIETLKQHDHLG